MVIRIFETLYVALYSLKKIIFPLDNAVKEPQFSEILEFGDTRVQVQL